MITFIRLVKIQLLCNYSTLHFNFGEIIIEGLVGEKTLLEVLGNTLI